MKVPWKAIVVLAVFMAACASSEGARRVVAVYADGLAPLAMWTAVCGSALFGAAFLMAAPFALLANLKGRFQARRFRKKLASVVNRQGQ